MIYGIWTMEPGTGKLEYLTPVACGNSRSKPGTADIITGGATWPESTKGIMSIFYNNVQDAAAKLRRVNTRMSKKEEKQFLYFMTLKKVATPQGDFAIVSLNEEGK